MTIPLPRSASRQVALVVAVAVLLSNLIVLGAWHLIDRPTLLPGSIRALQTEAVFLLRMFETAEPGAEEGVRTTARSLGFGLTSLPPGVVPAGQETHVSRMIADAARDAGMDARISSVAPPPDTGERLIVEQPGRSALLLDIGPERLERARPNLLLPPTSILFLVGLPLLVVMLWAARRVTRPLSELARAAERVGVSGDGALPEAGTTEVQQLAHAINSLVGRIRRDVSERTRLMAAISHDLRTPLTRLHLRVDAMPEGEVRDRLLRDVAAMERIAGGSLLLLEAELRQEPFERLDVAALAATVCDTFADAGHDVAYEGPDRLAARAQPRALERALCNLAENAVKYAGAARISLRSAGGGLLIAVEDDGPGIPEEHLPLVTQPFRRATEDAPGTGLGLAIVAGVARAHGGQLLLTNRLPRGLRAELSLAAG
jgi:signal transduction histidine kinase